MIGHMKNKIQIENPTIDVSFYTTPIQHSTMLSTVLENEASEATSNKDVNVHTNESTPNMISPSCLKIRSIQDQIASVSSSNIPIDDPDAFVNVCDNLENSVPFEIKDKSTNDLIDFSSDVTQREESLDENSDAEPQDEPVSPMEKSIEIVESSNAIGRVRTPGIGKLIFRRVAPACIFDSTQYAVEMIDRTEQPQEMFSTPTSPTDSSQFRIKDMNAQTNELSSNLISSSSLEIEAIQAGTSSISSMNAPIDDPNAFVNVTVNYDQVENRIFLEINDVDLATNGISKVKKYGSLSEESSDENLYAEQQDEPISPMDESIESSPSGSSNSPQISKNAMTNDGVRTPIGKLIFRRVAPACFFDNTQYAVEMIDRSQDPETLSPSSLSPRDYGEVCVTPTSHNMLTRNRASKANNLAHRFTYSPRIVLRRVNSLEDYHRQCRTTEPDKTQEIARAKLKLRRSRTKGK